MRANRRMSDTTDTLLIGGGFFGYAQEIVAALNARNRRAQWFEDRPATDTLTKSLIRLTPSLVVKRSNAYFDNIISQTRNKPIRDVLVIKGEALSIASIHNLRAAFPNAQFTLYFWDSYRNMPIDSAEKVPLFHKAFTFDPVDARADSRLQYRPLFFLDDYARLPEVEQDIDVLFFGTAHSDRLVVLRRLSKLLPKDTKIKTILYFPSRLIFAARHIVEPAIWISPNHFIFQPLGKSTVKSLIARAKVVIDIERQVQSGLTMRTIEMLGAGKKLVTTNGGIVQADFFNPANIAVIDRRNPVIDPGFLAGAYEPVSAELLRRYSLTGWLDEVLPSAPQL